MTPIRLRQFHLLGLAAVLAVLADGCSKRSGPAGRGGKNRADGPPIVSPLSDADQAALAEKQARALELIRSRYPQATLNHGNEDLRWIQRIIDDKAVGKEQTFDLQCLGAALGQVFAKQTRLRWVVVEDQLGRDLALQYPGTTVLVFPLTMISKRVEDDRPFDVAEVFDGVLDHIEKIKDDPRYKE